MIELAISPLELEAETQSLLDILEAIENEHAVRADLVAGMIGVRRRAIEANTKEAWIQAAIYAQKVIESSRMNDPEFSAGCRLKELAGRMAGLVLK
jgi:hypothetical protein